MADSKDKNDTSSENFTDDLDAMLNDAESSTDTQDEIIDDEDTIDRLLMDDAFDVEKEETADDLLDSVLADSKVEEDALAGTDEFSEDIIEPEPEPEPDFLLADFDISAADDNNGDEDSLLDAFIEEENTSEEELFESATNLVEDIEEEPDLVLENTDIAPVVSSQPDARIEKIKSEVDAIVSQINQLRAENETLTQKIDECVSLNETKSSAEGEIENLQLEQRKLRKVLKENQASIPVITYVAIGIAVLALLVGGGLGAIGYGAQSEVTELNELVVTLEEEIEILTAKDVTAEIKKTNERIVILIAKDADINKQISKVKKVLQSNILKPVVDDLVKQNDHAQEAIELLLAKVETLEKRKVFTKKSKKPKKVVPKVVWVVNLVSFKQEWYAKRKAAEFEKKGIPAEVIQVKVNGENWFRLRVTGFKSKYEAAAYAVKVKKTLNLSSVWVNEA